MEGNNIKIRPLFDNVIVKKDEMEEKTKTGIIIQNSDENPALVGTVISVGKDVEEEIKKGDRIMYAPFSGRELGGFLILAQHDIMGIVEDGKEEKKNGKCEKHGRIMLHEDRCHDCRNEETKSIRQELADKKIRELDNISKEMDSQLLGDKVIGKIKKNVACGEEIKQSDLEKK